MENGSFAFTDEREASLQKTADILCSSEWFTVAELESRYALMAAFMCSLPHTPTRLLPAEPTTLQLANLPGTELEDPETLAYYDAVSAEYWTEQARTQRQNAANIAEWIRKRDALCAAWRDEPVTPAPVRRGSFLWWARGLAACMVTFGVCLLVCAALSPFWRHTR